MSQQYYTIDLQDTAFPMLSEQQGMTTILPSPGNPIAGNKPKVAYMHNVMPSQYGLDSVAYLNTIPAATTLLAPFSDTRVIFGDERSRVELAWDDLGNVYALLDGAAAWINVPATVPATGGIGFSAESVTVGTVNGVSYIFYSTIGGFTYDEGTNTLVAVSFPALTIGDVLGMVASSGYLVAYTNEAVAWSSTIDPTDFTPSQVTGAGGGNVSDIDGSIIFVTTNPTGLIFHTKANAIAASYTGNVSFPFKFTEIPGSKGGIGLDLVAYEANTERQFIYSKGGLQSVSGRQAEVILPEVTDFLAGKRFEDYNETTKLYEYTDLPVGTTMLKKIKLIASRYLVISYGITSYTHALVFDTALQKLGKLKLTHVDVFEYVGTQDEIAKSSIAMLLSDGAVHVVDFTKQADSSGVLILGKLQVSNSRFMTLLGVAFTNIETAATIDVSDQSSVDGKTFAVVQGSELVTASNLRDFGFRNTAKNHSLALIGKFDLVSAVVTFTPTSRR